MSPAESSSMAAVLSPLLNSFHAVPPAAIPPMLDCILVYSGSSPVQLYDFLLTSFSDHIKHIAEDNVKLGLEDCNFLVAYLSSLSHLLKNSGVGCVGFRSFISKAFIPLMKMGHMYGRETLAEIQESFFEIVTINSNWGVVEDTLVPFLLRSVAISMDLHQNDDTTIVRWSRYLVSSDLESTVLPLSISCHILSSLLSAVMHVDQAVRSPLGDSLAGEFCTKKLLGTLMSDLCHLTFRMLLNSSGHRSCAVSLLFPTILDGFASQCSFEIHDQGEACNISRNYFFMKTWECCRSLFSLGPVERRDAYGIMSLYLSYLPSDDGSEVEVVHRADDFTIITEKEFWDEIKRGLVDKEGLVRKQALHILKKTMLMNEDTKSSSSFPEKILCENNSIPNGMKKRDLWADKEAQSLGVGQACRSFDPSLGKLEKWQAFLLLYEMLEEYGTHLVEAAWNHQIALLLSPSSQEDGSLDVGFDGKLSENPYMNFCWLAILWERGLFHDNPLVRCLIMQSFLDIDWKKHGNTANLFPESFLLGPFIEGLNDPVHHKDFGLKGFYSSKTIEGASRFLYHYSSFFDERKLVSFLCRLASVARHRSLGRAGLVAVAECLASASLSSTTSMVQNHDHRTCEDVEGMESLDTELCTDKTNLIDNFRFLMKSSKQHFNSNYRLRVCEMTLQAAVSVVRTHELPLEMLLLFVAALPREFTDDGGPLRSKVHEWLAGYETNNYPPGCSHDKMVLQNFLEFPYKFCGHDHAVDSCGHYDDDDLISWGAKSDRWARVLFLQIKEGQQLEPLFTFLMDKGIAILQQNKLVEWVSVKFLILILSLVRELEIMQRKAEQGLVLRTEIKPGLHELLKDEKHGQMSCIVRKFAHIFLIILKDLISFAASSCSIFWSDMVVGSVDLPGAVTGRLGGPSQRRLSSSITTSVLQAITSMKAVACLSSWLILARIEADLNVPVAFLWEFLWKVLSSSTCESEASSEIYVAAYEVLSSILKALAPVLSSSMINIVLKTCSMVSTPEKELTSGPILDPLVFYFLKHINNFLSSGLLARARIAVLLNWKWTCLESLLSIPYNSHQNRVQLDSSITLFSRGAVKIIFHDLVESLENAGEDSVLPMLRSVRYVLDMLTSGAPFVSEDDGIDVQMMWQLVHSSWILHTSCNKRRVAPIAALLSSILHASVFRDERMHVVDDVAGPLKWFCGKVLEEGTKSPRTIRLAALHLTGLWLSNPKTIKYYLKELKLLTLYGSVAFDEDFESELNENGDARSEVALLAKSPDPELTEVFINTELYGRVSVAVLFYKLAEMESRNDSDDSHAAFESGKLFLLELLDSAVNDIDLAKELYKKYSAIHRRKVRVWQMICVLSRFVNQEIVHQVADMLHLAIYRNNMPSVRQYMETFAINLFLKFPHLVGQQLVPILRKYDMRTQALSSYVFVAANLILHANESVQSQHLEALLPPLVPLLTSHHHTLRGFTQLLLHKVLSKEFPVAGEGCSASSSLENKCFLDLKSYLNLNPDCLRLRSSMERFLDTFSPEHSITPSGIFSCRIEAREFECVPMSLMEQVVSFLNDARDELRHAMANDEVIIKNENLKMSTPSSNMDHSINEKNQEGSLACQPSDISLDFQKKFTLLKHEMENDRSASFLDRLETYRPLAELEKEDKLLVQMMQSRFASMEKLNTSRQELILVASLIDRIPNLAGLARTCEVFKATSLVIADTSVLHDRQFQLISVTAEKWIPIIEVPANSVTTFLEKKKREGFSVLGLEQTANSVPLDKFEFPKRTVLVLGREKEGIPVDIIHTLDACIEIPQLGVVRSLNVHVSGAIALWEYTRQQRSK